VDADLRDLGEHRFKDLSARERVYQLGGRDFPPIRSLGRTNLPVAAWPLLGRERELAEIRTLVADGVRLLTLTGPGGSGKTRLALQAAAELSDEFLDGTFFAALAPLRETQAVRSTVAQAVGLQPDDDVASWLSSRRVLLVLDNLEHLQGVARVIAELLVGEVVMLATSRAPLHLSFERELPVEPLLDEAAAELFVSRARHEHLSAKAGRRNPGSTMDVDADVTLAGEERRTRVQTDAHTNQTGIECVGQFSGGSDGFRRRRKCHEEGLALGIDLHSIVTGTCLADDLPVRGKCTGIDLRPQLVQELGRPLDVGEEEGDSAGRKLLMHPP
jgi:hypothetical protein